MLRMAELRLPALRRPMTPTLPPNEARRNRSDRRKNYEPALYVRSWLSHSADPRRLICRIQPSWQVPCCLLSPAQPSPGSRNAQKNPAAVLREANNRPVAVLNHNRAAFYMVEPRLFEAMMEELADQELYRKAVSRLAEKSRAVEVDIDDL